MKIRTISVVLCMFLCACRQHEKPLYIDALLNTGDSLLHAYGLGKAALLDCKNILSRRGEFPLTVIAFKSPRKCFAKLSISLVNRVPRQIMGGSFNYKTIFEHTFQDTPDNAEILEKTFTIDVEAGINILTISYLNSQDTEINHNYELGKLRVQFTKLIIEEE